jgi:alpha-1,2-mannosyltransferase
MTSALHHQFGFDLRIFLEASHRVVHGRSAYPDPAAVLHARRGQPDIFVYPPVLAVVLIPLNLVSFHLASAIFTAISAAAIVLALRLLGVDDWRCYTLAFASIPVLSSLRLGAISPLLTLAAAAAWRYRHHWLIAGASVGGAVVAKLFVWPLVLWLLFTRRWKAAAVSTVGAATVTLAVWGLLGFRGLREFPTLLRDLSHVESVQSFSLVALADRLGLPEPQTSWIALALTLGLAMLATCFAASPGGDLDRRIFITAVGLSLLLTPILWLHYFTIMLVPVALASPRLGPEWFLFLGYWLTPNSQPGRLSIWSLLIALAITFAIIVRAQRTGDEPRGSARPDRSAPPIRARGGAPGTGVRSPGSAMAR